MATSGCLTRSKQYLSGRNIACVPCRSRIKRGKTNRGVKYCVDCQQFLCTVCVNKHNSVSVFAGHSLLDRSKFRTLGGSKDGHSASLRTKRHKLHSTKVLDTDQRRRSDKRQREKLVEPRTKLYTFEHVGTHNINLPINIDITQVWTLCILDSGDILLADRYYKILKLLDGRTYCIKDKVKIPHIPTSVCKGRTHEAIVALENEGIQFVSTKKNLVLTNILRMDHICLGVCMISSNIFVTDGINRNIFKYDLEGKLLKIISGETIFGWNRFLVASDDGKALFVTDKNEGLVKMDLEGNVIWKLPENGFRGALDLCKDGFENIFVACHDSNNVVQVTYDGECLGEVVKGTHGTKIAGICFDRNTSKLVVGEMDGSRIHVYSVKEEK